MSRTRKDSKKYREKIAEQLDTFYGCIGFIPSSWKRLRKRKRKAKEKQAMRKGKYDDIPKFKQNDDYY